ncbi:tRNA (guanine-N1)-methyltransferase, partial [Candidatus Micrarchaeota archaeon]|nr:tRNA (guanine-N1)-methyltransferase [Candidatus Micrarchaeota archaeon]
ADRILMPLPKSAKLFLEDAMHSAKDGGIIHFYSFVPLKNAYDSAVSLVEKSSEKCGCRVKILNKREVRTYAPDIIQVVIDFQVLKGK